MEVIECCRLYILNVAMGTELSLFILEKFLIDENTLFLNKLFNAIDFLGLNF